MLPRKAKQKAVTRFSRTGSNSELPQNCVICLDLVVARGKLSTCSHWFCFPCILEWSKNTNTCPLCKTRFRCITKVQASGHGSPSRTIRVKDKDQSIVNHSADDYAVAMGLLSDSEDDESDVSGDHSYLPPTTASQGQSRVGQRYSTRLLRRDQDERLESRTPMYLRLRERNARSSHPVSERSGSLSPSSSVADQDMRFVSSVEEVDRPTVGPTDAPESSDCPVDDHDQMPTLGDSLLLVDDSNPDDSWTGQACASKKIRKGKRKRKRICYAEPKSSGFRVSAERTATRRSSRNRINARDESRPSLVGGRARMISPIPGECEYVCTDGSTTGDSSMGSSPAHKTRPCSRRRRMLSVSCDDSEDGKLALEESVSSESEISFCCDTRSRQMNYRSVAKTCPGADMVLRSRPTRRISSCASSKSDAVSESARATMTIGVGSAKGHGEEWGKCMPGSDDSMSDDSSVRKPQRGKRRRRIASGSSDGSDVQNCRLNTHGVSGSVRNAHGNSTSNWLSATTRAKTSAGNHSQGTSNRAVASSSSSSLACRSQASPELYRRAFDKENSLLYSPLRTGPQVTVNLSPCVVASTPFPLSQGEDRESAGFSNVRSRREARGVKMPTVCLQPLRSSVLQVSNREDRTAVQETSMVCGGDVISSTPQRKLKFIPFNRRQHRLPRSNLDEFDAA